MQVCVCVNNMLVHTLTGLIFALRGFGIRDVRKWVIKDVGIDWETADRLSSQNGGAVECIVSKYVLINKRKEYC